LIDTSTIMANSQELKVMLPLMILAINLVLTIYHLYLLRIMTLLTSKMMKYLILLQSTYAPKHVKNQLSNMFTKCEMVICFGEGHGHGFMFFEDAKNFVDQFISKKEIIKWLQFDVEKIPIQKSPKTHKRASVIGKKVSDYAINHNIDHVYTSIFFPLNISFKAPE